MQFFSFAKRVCSKVSILATHSMLPCKTVWSLYQTPTFLRSVTYMVLPANGLPQKQKPCWQWREEVELSIPRIIEKQRNITPSMTDNGCNVLEGRQFRILRTDVVQRCPRWTNRKFWQYVFAMNSNPAAGDAKRNCLLMWFCCWNGWGVLYSD